MPSPGETAPADAHRTCEGRVPMARERRRMKCPRCNGAMVYERFQDMLDLFYAWRCLNCGEIVDPVVARNRGTVKKAKKSVAG